MTSRRKPDWKHYGGGGGLLLSRDQNRSILAGGPGRCPRRVFPRTDIGPDSVKNWSYLKVVLMVSAIGACRQILRFLTCFVVLY